MSRDLTPDELKILSKNMEEQGYMGFEKFCERLTTGRKEEEEMLKETLFEKTKVELEKYQEMADVGDPKAEMQRYIFCGLYSVIEEAGLEDEYNKWRGSEW